MGNPSPEERSDDAEPEPPPDSNTGDGPQAVPDVLKGSSPRKILERLVDGDPLELAARCQESIEESALLVDPYRLQLRTVARVAHAAPTYRGDPPLTAWIRSRIEQSMQELISEDREEERSGMPPPDVSDPRYEYVSEVLGIETTLARRACVAFNSLPHGVRCAWFAVAVEGMTVNRYVAEGYGPPDRVKRDLKLALTTIARAIGSCRTPSAMTRSTTATRTAAAATSHGRRSMRRRNKHGRNERRGPKSLGM